MPRRQHNDFERQWAERMTQFVNFPRRYTRREMETNVGAEIFCWEDSDENGMPEIAKDKKILTLAKLSEVLTERTKTYAENPKNGSAWDNVQSTIHAMNNTLRAVHDRFSIGFFWTYCTALWDSEDELAAKYGTQYTTYDLSGQSYNLEALKVAYFTSGEPWLSHYVIRNMWLNADDGMRAVMTQYVQNCISQYILYSNLKLQGHNVSNQEFKKRCSYLVLHMPTEKQGADDELVELKKGFLSCLNMNMGMSGRIG